MTKTARKKEHPEEKQGADVLERGDIYFLYRPAVEVEHPAGLEDVERFFMVLKPKNAGLYRLIVIGEKRLPDLQSHERYWGFVEAVEKSGKAIEERLSGAVYETQTRGTRHLPAARPAGEGKYVLAFAGRSLHLLFVLDLPEKPAEVQKAFHLPREAAMVMAVKNPEASAPPGVGLPKEEKADYPRELIDVFRHRRFAGEDVRLLDYAGAEFI